MCRLITCRNGYAIVHRNRVCMIAAGAYRPTCMHCLWIASVDVSCALQFVTQTLMSHLFLSVCRIHLLPPTCMPETDAANLQSAASNYTVCHRAAELIQVWLGASRTTGGSSILCIFKVCTAAETHDHEAMAQALEKSHKHLVNQSHWRGTHRALHGEEPSRLAQKRFLNTTL